jgi:glutamine---fructose-6-phosphate transaminase (isomerizing)
MCGIVGYIGLKEAAPLLSEGLKRLEYRGYDSAGLAIMTGGSLRVLRSVGKLANLDALTSENALTEGCSMKGSVGLGHTRWATHGRPSVANAHPHTDCTGKIAVVHNGIVENHQEIRRDLQEKGHSFRSETDTEVLAHLVEEKLKDVQAAPAPMEKATLLLEAVRRSLLDVRGAYALAVLWSELPDMIVAAKTSSPLVIGLGDGETFVASDVPAFLAHTRQVLFLEDGEMALLGARERIFFKLDGVRISKDPITIPWDHTMAQKAGYPHFMLKEIHEQPKAIENTLRGRLGPLNDGVLEREAGMPPDYIRSIREVQLVACGTAYHAAIVGRYMLERYARLPAHVETASEFRYRSPILTPNTLVIAISQSGETADTLAAVRLARDSGARVLAISNTVGSAMTRAADFTLYTHCGPECGVASTKAFIGQLAALNILTLHLATTLGKIPMSEAVSWQEELSHLPDLIQETLGLESQIIEVARKLQKSEHCVFIGRGLNYPTALEGALKLKEISYIHAEGYAAGEMKHGPIALLDPSMTVVALATGSATFEKMASNIEEARSREAKLVTLCTRGEMRARGKSDEILEIPSVSEIVSPILNTVPLQLLAYHTAKMRGCDIDQPRNLAKSVTVE